jgi:hypothetical protein
MTTKDPICGNAFAEIMMWNAEDNVSLAPFIPFLLYLFGHLAVSYFQAFVGRVRLALR